ncbi:hypothetical protein PIB30_012653 [Stylosanthes scabra]|uniref:HhH-GPD domain-containing protein n=1 Tax=Stylosanthes scabra TaxID=79078 RepID=A0ABU6Z2T8_9FABA|nr:hypothetical protein [Stylosanthes scabra]
MKFGGRILGQDEKQFQRQNAWVPLTPDKLNLMNQMRGNFQDFPVPGRDYMKEILLQRGQIGEHNSVEGNSTDRNRVLNHIAGSSYTQASNYESSGLSSNTLELLLKDNATNIASVNKNLNWSINMAARNPLLPKFHHEATGDVTNSYAGVNRCNINSASDIVYQDANRLVTPNGNSEFNGGNSNSLLNSSVSNRWMDIFSEIPKGDSYLKHNMNYMPPREADAAANITSCPQTIPETMDQLKFLEQLCTVPDYTIAESTSQEKDIQEYMASSREKETQQYCDGLLQQIVDSSFGISAPNGDQNGSDNNICEKGVDLGFDLNKTPEQRVSKRRKHRPKVIVENKPKRSPNPTTRKRQAKERGAGKKENVTKNPATPQADLMKETSDSTVSARKSCRKALNFDTEESRNERQRQTVCELNISKRNEKDFNNTSEYKATEMLSGANTSSDFNMGQEEHNGCKQQYVQPKEIDNLSLQSEACFENLSTSLCQEILQGDEKFEGASLARGSLKTQKRKRSQNRLPSKVRGRPPSLSGETLMDKLINQLNNLNLGDSNISQIEGQKALVPYMQDASIIPYQESQFVKKLKPRPRVDLDPETERTWKLLMGKEGSEGHEETDKDKAKWWEDERNVFRGRANSFIARMHLVQGDRRFSKWKGSVVDSVIGVFLTQNVSDHLSSSAFMSLAARFPLKSNSSKGSNDVTGRHKLQQEPELCKVYPQETMISFGGETLTQPTPTYQLGFQTPHLTREIWTGSEMSSMKGSLQNACNQISEEEFLSSQDSLDSTVIQGCSGSNSESEGPNSQLLTSTMHSLEVGSATMFQEFFNSVNGVSLFEEQVQQSEHAKESSILGTKNGTILPCITTQRNELQLPPENVDMQSKNPIPVHDISHLSCMQALPNHDLVDLKNLQAECCSVPKHVESEKKQVFSDKQSKPKVSRGKKVKHEQAVDWDELRKEVLAKRTIEKSKDAMDSLDYEAVRCASVKDISEAIKERGMNNMLAERIKEFLNRLVNEHGSIDLEWLRYVPADKAKDYLLSIRGLGLKSVECVRLLTLHNLAFPVDTNVGRIAVRLGWVPLRPLPESLQLHLLELYPILESVQKYLWPRLCKLDQKTLYELHYQMITFGKVFCTKSRPNCNACPMRAECRHFASAFASARLALPGPEEKGITSMPVSVTSERNPSFNVNPAILPLPEINLIKEVGPESGKCEPIIEEPATPEQELTETIESDIEDFFFEEDHDPDEIPTIKISEREFARNVQNCIQEFNQGDMSKALVALDPQSATIPMPKLKNVNRLRTEHQVYELPDSHPLLEKMDKREPDDLSPYLLAIWTPGETANSIEPPERRCTSQDSTSLCNDETCFSCNSIREANSQTVRGTILIPCRTATRGSFPLNGTYFQVNELFADHASSVEPIEIPREWLWNLPRRTVYFGTSVTSIFRGLSTQEIQLCFWRGFVCVRGFDQETRAPRPLRARLHFPVSRLAKTKKNESRS